MSYTAKVFYVLESDPTYTLKYDSLVKDVNIGDSFSLSFLDFDYNKTHYYVKYAINNGSVYKRGVNTIDCKSMMISDDYRYMSWYVFCTEDETDITGDCAVSYTDIATELYLSISTGNSDSVSTRGKETLISVSISQGCVSDSFASYGSTYSPTMSCEMYAENNDFTDALIAKTYYDNTVKGTIVNAWILIGNEFAYPVPIGRFVVKENPTYNGDTVSFNGNGLMSEYMDRAEIAISSLNEYHKTELEEKYVPSQLQFIYTRDDVYYWEYLPQDFLRVTGCPLYIDNWKDVLSSIKQYKLYHLMIPMLSNFADNDEDGYDWDWESRITWRDLLSGIAVLLRANVIEKNGAFYIKQLPELQADNNYRPIFNGDTYDSNAIFGNNLMCPNNVSVKANNWYFYETNSDYVGFGYYEGESTVVLNDKASSVSNVENYPVTIETPWILYETLDRNTVHTYLGQVTPMQWKTGLSFLNKAFVYHKASIETMYWHPLMSVGEMLTFEDYDGVKKYVLVGEMTLHYDGGFYAEITSPCEVQESNSSSVGSSGSSSYNSGTMAQASGTVTSTILGAIFKDGVITNSKIADSTIENSKIKDSTITNAKIADATIELEKVSKSFITDLTADNAYIKHLKATIGEFGYITAENADLTYATITSLQAVDGKIDTLTAKAITTDNLEAKVATLGYLSAESADVKFATIESLTAVDGKIDTLSSKAITTENLSAKVADLGYLSADNAAWKVDTDAELSSLKTRTMNLETEMGDKVSTSTFNEVKQTVDENSASIMSLSDTVGKKADGSTVETLTNTVNEVKQTADSNSLSISSMQTEIGKKADDSTVTELSKKTSNLEQNLDGFKTEVSKTYTTKTEFDDLSIGGRNLVLQTSKDYCAPYDDFYGTLNTCIFEHKVLADGLKEGDVITIRVIYKYTDIVATNGENAIFYIQGYGNVGEWNTGTFPKSEIYTIQGSGEIEVKYVAQLDKEQVRNQYWTLNFRHDYVTSGSVQIKMLKVEKGNKATDWSPAPEDIEQTSKSYTDQKADEITQVVSKKVGADEIISKINQTAETITIDASKLNLTGYVTIENLKGSGTTEINGANIITGSIDANKLNVTDLSALNASIGGFRITEDAITMSGETFYTALSSKPLTDETPYGALVSYWRMQSAGTYYGSYSQISYGVLEAGTISGTTPTYTPSFKVNGDSITLGNIASLEIKNKELIGIFDGTTPTIATRTLTLNAMSLAGNYDGETTGTIESVELYEVLAVIPRTSAADVCWINCYFDSSNVVHARLKNTVSSAKNNFKPTVEVLYRLI